MEILKKRDGETLKVDLVGRLDTTTGPELESNLIDELDDVTELILDFEQLDYVSSAGLRVLLVLQKKMNKQGNMVIRNVSESIIEVFDITGFIDILTIE
ncbi:MAG: STAS domain-containing protein [Lachnospiraceae bacterium]|nr:STAS domain-containing protein [Lachnospiraceae bacterium]